MSRPPPARHTEADDSISSSHALMEAQSLLDELTATGGRLAHLPARAFALACLIAGMLAVAVGVHHYFHDPGRLGGSMDLIDGVAVAGALITAWGAFAAWRGQVDLLARQLLSLCVIAFYAFAMALSDMNAALFMGGLAVFLHLVLPRRQALAAVAALALATVAVPWVAGMRTGWDKALPVLATAGLVTLMLQSIAAQAEQVRRVIHRSTRRLQALQARHASIHRLSATQVLQAPPA